MPGEKLVKTGDLDKSVKTETPDGAGIYGRSANVVKSKIHRNSLYHLTQGLSVFKE